MLLVSTMIAVGTWVLAVGTLIAIWVEVRDLRVSRSAEAFARFTERWDSPAMMWKRRRLAIALCDPKTRQVSSEIIESVIVFFEDLGTALREKYISEHAALSRFSYWTRQYWLACGKGYVERLRDQSGDIAYFKDFEIFVEEMKKEESKRGAHAPGAESIRAFLDSEAGLPQLPS